MSIIPTNNFQCYKTPPPPPSTGSAHFPQGPAQNERRPGRQAGTAEPDAAEPETPATDASAEEASTKPESGKDDTTVEGNGDGNGQVPPGQHEDEDGTIVNNGGNVAPGLNRSEHIDKPENPNKPNKPENPGAVALFEPSERANQKQAPTAGYAVGISLQILPAAAFPGDSPAL